MASKFDWIKTCNYLVRDLPEQCLRHLGRKLSDNLETVAHDLGLDNGELEEARETSYPGMALLKAWSWKPDTTVFMLYNVLNNRKRQDAIDILKRHISEVELVFVIETKEGIKSRRINVGKDEKIIDVIKWIPELSTAPHINFKMESPPQNISEATAAEFKGRQIRITLLDKPERNSDFTRTTAIQHRPGPNSYSVNLPVQETCHISGTDIKQRLGDFKEEGMPTTISVEPSSTTSTYMNIQIFHPNMWPLLSEKQEEIILRPYLNEPGTYIVRQSRQSSKCHTICVVDTDSQIIHFRILQHGDDNMYLFEDGPVFHDISELTQFYTKNNMKKENDGKPLRLTTNI